MSTRPKVRLRLLDAAERLFYERGISATPVDAVLAAAESSPASLYAHFRGKDGLVAAYLERRMGRWLAVWDAEVARHDEPRGRLLAVLDALEHFRADQPARRGCAFLAASAELTDTRHPAASVVGQESATLDARLTALAGELPVADPGHLAQQVRLAYDGALAGFVRADRSSVPGANQAEVLCAARGLATAAIDAAVGRREQASSPEYRT